MGASNSHHLHAELSAGEFRRLVDHSDSSLGRFQLVRFSREPSTIFLLESFDPKELERLGGDFKELVACVGKKHKHVCEFSFVAEGGAAGWQGVFEYGDAVFPSFHSEKLVWGFLSNVLNGLLFLQAAGFHYPCVHKRYTIFNSSQNCFKLLNPFCFPEFRKQVAAIYKNPNVYMSEKQKLFDASAVANLREVGAMLYSVLTGSEHSSLPHDLRCLRPNLTGKISPALLDFLMFCLEPRTVPVASSQLASFFTGLFAEARKIGTGGFALPLTAARSETRSLSPVPSPQVYKTASMRPHESQNNPIPGDTPHSPIRRRICLAQSDNPFREIDSNTPTKPERANTPTPVSNTPTKPERVNTPSPVSFEACLDGARAQGSGFKSQASRLTMAASTTSILSGPRPAAPPRTMRLLLMGLAGSPDSVLFSSSFVSSSKFEKQRKLVDDFKVQRPTLYHVLPEDAPTTPSKSSLSHPHRVPTLRDLSQELFS